MPRRRKYRQIISNFNHLSAPVRKRCAELIGEYGWDDGLNELCTLLYDNHDSRDMQDENVDHAIAVAAAIALRKFDVSNFIFEKMFEFVLKGRDANADAEVHANILLALSNFNDERVAGLYVGFLDDKRGNLNKQVFFYYIRHVSAISAVYHILNFGSSSFEHLLISFSKWAIHEDYDVSIPCVMVLCLCGDNGQQLLVSLARARAINSARLLLGVACATCVSRPVLRHTH